MIDRDVIGKWRGRNAAAFAAILLAGCAGAGGWTRAGTDKETTAREYKDCQDLVATAVKTDADIDQDISSTRSSDLQRSDLLRMEMQDTRQVTSDRAAAILGACMRTKGFAPASG